jgi:ribosomal protein L24E
MADRSLCAVCGKSLKPGTSILFIENDYRRPCCSKKCKDDYESGSEYIRVDRTGKRLIMKKGRILGSQG